jgi:N-sulfoglucosamine sulfohydrolase
MICLAKAEAIKPNIVLFLADDQSVWDLGCYGNPAIRTPKMDQLASEGLRFNRAFTSTAMCAPSRSMLYTGLYPHRNGCHMNHGTTREGVKSLPHYLKPLGYRVVLADKTHIKPKSVYPFEYINQNDIDKVILGKQPYCLIIASQEPHTPHQQGKYKAEDVPVPPYLPDVPAVRKDLAGYYTDIDSLDLELGQALDLVKSSGKESNTLFIYTSDHGNSLMAKWTCYETGLRVPMIARWPGQIEPKSQTDAMIDFVDVLPTFIEIAGGKAPNEIDGQSFLEVLTGKQKEHRKLIYGAHTNQGIISGQPYPVRSVRNERYKYIRNLNPSGIPSNTVTHLDGKEVEVGGVWGEWKQAAKTNANAAQLLSRVMTRPVEELYDLQEDPWEMKNLATEPAQAAVKTELSTELDRWMKRQGDLGMQAELAVTPHQSLKGE